MPDDVLWPLSRIRAESRGSHLPCSRSHNSARFSWDQRERSLAKGVSFLINLPNQYYSWSKCRPFRYVALYHKEVQHVVQEVQDSQLRNRIAFPRR